MARLKEIVVDADRPAALARFWSEALDGYAIRAYDAAEVARLAALGLSPESDPSVMVDGPGPTLCFQRMEGPRPPRNRLHLDVASPDRAGEVARLVALGARPMREAEGYTVLRDPEGHNFCVVDEVVDEAGAQDASSATRTKRASSATQMTTPRTKAAPPASPSPPWAEPKSEPKSDPPAHPSSEDDRHEEREDPEPPESHDRRVPEPDDPPHDDPPPEEERDCDLLLDVPPPDRGPDARREELPEGFLDEPFDPPDPFDDPLAMPAPPRRRNRG